MAIDIGAALREGYERTVARNGLTLVGVLYLVSVLDGLLSTGRPPSARFGPSMGPGVDAVAPAVVRPYAPSLGLSPLVAGVLSLLLGVASLVVTIGALRTFASDETERLPREHFSRDLLWTGLNLIVGGVVFGIAVGIGFVLLVVPGLFLLVSLFFWEVHVVVEDANLVDGFRESWALTGGHRLRLFALGVAVVLVGVVVGVAFGLPGIVLPDALGFLVAQVGSAFVGVFTLATVARTYERLRAERGAPGG